MRSSLKPVILLLAVPVLASAIAMFGRVDWEAQWSTSLARQMMTRGQRPDTRVIERYSLPVLCSDKGTAARFPPCRTYTLFSGTIGASAVVAGLGFLLLGTVVVAGRACAADRTRLVRVFAPALGVTIGGVVVLVLVNGALGLLALQLLGGALGQWPVGLLVALQIGVLLVIIGAVRVAIAASRRTMTVVAGRSIDLGAHQRLAGLVEDLAGRIGAERPRSVVVGLVPGAFVTAAPITCLDGPVQGPTLYLSLSLCRILAIDELRAILGHELAHWTGGQAAFGHHCAPAHASARFRAARLGAQARGLRQLTVQPVLSVLSFFLDAFGVAMAEAVHERETAADRTAAGVAGPVALGTALARIHAFGPAWETVRDAMRDAVAGRWQYANASLLFAEVVAANAGPERLRGLGRMALGHPTDAHAPLGARLAMLGVDPEQVAAAVTDTVLAPTAISLFERPGELEEDLSRVEHRLMLTPESDVIEPRAGRPQEA